MFGYQVLGFGAGGKSASVEATGGNTVTDNGDFKVHTFTSPGQITFQAIPATASVEYLLVAGGGGGGDGGGDGGAGGAGGLVEGSSTSFTAAAFAVTVGSGGAGKGQP